MKKNENKGKSALHRRSLISLVDGILRDMNVHWMDESSGQ